MGDQLRLVPDHVPDNLIPGRRIPLDEDSFSAVACNNIPLLRSWSADQAPAGVSYHDANSEVRQNRSLISCQADCIALHLRIC